MFIRGICGLLAVFTLFLLTLSLIFSFGGEAPNIFGKNIYIVKTNALEILSLNPGTALITSVVSPDEINSGDIVIFKSSENRAGIAEIESVRVTDNIYGFEAVSERGTDMVLTQSQIVGKAVYYSDFLGGLIGFIKSPVGVLVIAVIPCVIILIYEASKSIFSALNKDEQIIPVKKQDEIPTYVPRQKVAAVMSAYGKNEKEDDDGFDFFEKEKDETDYPLFLQPKPPHPIEKPAPRKNVPLSQKRLNDAMTEVNNARNIGNTQGITRISVNPIPITSEPPVRTPKEEPVRRYTPKKTAEAKIHQTTSMPSLDKLLKDDEVEKNTSYNIEDILYAIDKKK